MRKVRSFLFQKEMKPLCYKFLTDLTWSLGKSLLAHVILLNFLWFVHTHQSDSNRGMVQNGTVRLFCEDVWGKLKARVLLAAITLKNKVENTPRGWLYSLTRAKEPVNCSTFELWGFDLLAIGGVSNLKIEKRSPKRELAWSCVSVTNYLGTFIVGLAVE